MKNCYKDANRTITELWKAYYKIKPYQTEKRKKVVENVFNSEYRRIRKYISEEELFQ